MNTAMNLSRRQFLKATGTAASALAAAGGAPLIVSTPLWGATAPSNRITVGCIGTGNQGYSIMKKFLEHDTAQVVAVCDVNRASFGYRDENQFLGREPAQKTVNEYYAKKTTAGRLQRLRHLHRFPRGAGAQGY